MSHTAELIAVGTELLLGNIANTNAQYLSEKLSILGINVFYHTVVGDNPQRLKQAVGIARERADIIITTGGLGPTYDDLTKQTLSECFGRKLIYHEDIAAQMRAHFAAAGYELTENNFQQCWLPEDCTILENDRGTAPGCCFTQDGCTVIMLPGPPSECQNMFDTKAEPLLRAMSDDIIVSRTLRVMGIGESAAEALLRKQMDSLQNPTLAPYAKTGELELRITAKAKSEAEARALIAPVEAEVKEILGNKVYGVDVPNLESVCLRLLLEKGLTLGTAESCSGGLVAKRITDLPGASGAFPGGIVSYSNHIKTSLLGVPEEMLSEHSAVSEPVARAMALGARAALGCDVSIATTGVAGPGPDSSGNPAGLIYVAIADQNGAHVQKRQIAFRSREQVRMAAAQTALDMLRRYLTGLLSLS